MKSVKLSHESRQLLACALLLHNNLDPSDEKRIIEIHRPLRRDHAIKNKGVIIGIIDWKASRNTKRAQKRVYWGPKNVDLTRRAFRLADEGKLEEAIRELDKIRWVAPRTASAILMFYNPKKFTVMDKFAWAALKHLQLVSETDFGYKTAKDYPAYNNFCLSLAKAFDHSLRDADRALWFIGVNKESEDDN